MSNVNPATPVTLYSTATGLPLPIGTIHAFVNACVSNAIRTGKGTNMWEATPDKAAVAAFVAQFNGDAQAARREVKKVNTAALKAIGIEVTGIDPAPVATIAAAIGMTGAIAPKQAASTGAPTWNVAAPAPAPVAPPPVAPVAPPAPVSPPTVAPSPADPGVFRLPSADVGQLIAAGTLKIDPTRIMVDASDGSMILMPGALYLNGAPAVRFSVK